MPLVSHFHDFDVVVLTPDSRVSWSTSAGTNGSLPRGHRAFNLV